MIAKADKALNLTEKQEAFSVNMFTHGLETFGNGVQSAKKAGYKGNDKTLSVVASENLVKPCIIERKTQIQAITTQKVESLRDECIKVGRNILLNGTKESDQLKAMSLLGDFGGYKTDNAPNPERVALQALRTAEDTVLLKAIASEFMLRKAKSIDSKVLDERNEDVQR